MTRERVREETEDTVRRLLTIWCGADPNTPLDTKVKDLVPTSIIDGLHPALLPNLFLVAVGFESAEPEHNQLTTEATLTDVIEWLLGEPLPTDDGYSVEWSTEEKEPEEL